MNLSYNMMFWQKPKWEKNEATDWVVTFIIIFIYCRGIRFEVGTQRDEEFIRAQCNKASRGEKKQLPTAIQGNEVIIKF